MTKDDVKLTPSDEEQAETPPESKDETTSASDGGYVEGVDMESLEAYVDSLDTTSQEALLDMLKDKLGIDHEDTVDDHDEDNAPTSPSKRSPKMFDTEGME